MRSYWHNDMDEATARQLIGGQTFDYAVAKGPGYCASRIAGYWDANEPESYAAYRCAARFSELAADLSDTFRAADEAVEGALS